MTVTFQPNQIDIDLADPDDDSVFADQALGGAGDFTLDGADVSGGVWVSPDGFAHQLILTCAADESARTATVTGYYDINQEYPATITIAGSNASTTESTEYLAVITSVSFDGATTGNVKLGFVDEAIVFVGADPATRPITIQSVVTGTVNFDIQTTNTEYWKRTAQHPFTFLVSYEDVPFVSRSAAVTASAVLTLDGPVTGIRYLINSYSSGARIQADISMLLDD